MSRAMAVVASVAILAMTVVACSPASPGLTVAPTIAPSDQAGTGGQLGCAPVDLRDPSGRRVDLSGEWDPNPGFSGTAIVYLNQEGDCLFGSMIDGYLAGVDAPFANILNLQGRIDEDFTVDADLVFVFQDDVFPFGELSSTTFVIEWDDEGTIRLREDFGAGGRAGRCVRVDFDCAPIILTPTDSSAD